MTETSAILDAYTDEHVHLKCAAPERQLYAIANLKAWFSGKSIAEIDIPACRAYSEARRGGLVGRPSKGATIRRELSVLTSAANHAVKWKRLRADHVPIIEMPAASEPRNVYLERQELKDMIAAAEGEVKRFIRLSYYWGARKSSVSGLTSEQIDFSSGTVNLHRHGDQRTNKRKPIVPLYDAIKPDVEWLMDQKKGVRLFKAYDHYQSFKAVCEKAGTPDDKRFPHILRHTRATHLLQDGVSIYDVAKLLGDTVSTVEKTYGHHSTAYLQSTTGFGI